MFFSSFPSLFMTWCVLFKPRAKVSPCIAEEGAVWYVPLQLIPGVALGCYTETQCTSESWGMRCGTLHDGLLCCIKAIALHCEWPFCALYPDMPATCIHAHDDMQQSLQYTDVSAMKCAGFPNSGTSLQPISPDTALTPSPVSSENVKYLKDARLTVREK